MRPVALVTGASGGIGEALARLMAREGETLVLVARSQARLAAVGRSIEEAGGHVALTLPLDLALPDAAVQVRAALAERGLVVRHLVNNAGYGLAGDMAELPRQEQLGIVDLNCRALLDLTLTFLPDIIAGRGGVLNVASVAAFTPGPGLAVYYASKAFVLSLTRGLAAELAGQGVRVTALCPGPTPTGFGARAGFGRSRVADLTRPLSAEAVARIGLAGYRAGRLVVIPGLVYRILVAGTRLLPTALTTRAIAAIQRGRRRTGPIPPHRPLP